MHRPALRPVPRARTRGLAAAALLAALAAATRARAAAAALEPAPGAGCPGAPLALVSSGGTSLAVAFGLPPHSVAVLIGGATTEAGPVFGSGRLCVAQPRVRLGCAQANEDGAAVVRPCFSALLPSGGWVQMLWRDPLSGQSGATTVARW